MVWYRNAWVLRVHFDGRKKETRYGPTKSDKREAEAMARRINGRRAHTGQGFAAEPEPIPSDEALRAWHARYSVTFKPRYVETSRGLFDCHLVPFFGSRDRRDIREADLLAYISEKVAAGHRPSTILNALSILRRVLSLAVREGCATRNPASGCGRLIAKVAQREAEQAHVVDSWTRAEAETLLCVAEEEDRRSFLHRHASGRPGEARFAPLLRFLFSTGCRRGEALGLKWADVDFERSRVAIRRSLANGITTTPKSGKGRFVAMSPGLGSALLDLLGQRRAECLARGWSEVPAWVFCSETGGPLDERNVSRSWERVRRKAQKAGVRPLRLHCARHSFASLALAAGKSIRWVAEQLGHANPELTLRVYAHVLPSEGGDLSFVDFGAGLSETAPIAGRHNPSLPADDQGLSMERETGFEPATLSLGS